MKNRTETELKLRKEFAELLVKKRTLSREIRLYAEYDLRNRKINSISRNIEYLKILVNNYENLEKECAYLYRLLIKIRTNS